MDIDFTLDGLVLTQKAFVIEGLNGSINHAPY
jgi:hypothetical protein